MTAMSLHEKDNAALSSRPATDNQSSPDSGDADGASSDIEAQKQTSVKRVTHWQIVASQTLVTDAVLNHKYHGSGTAEDPYLVEFLPNDPRNPMNFPDWKKWSLIATVAMTTLAVAFVSTAYTGSIPQIIEDFETSREVATLGISLFVLGWALGPLIWAPLSELYGRQYIFFITYALVTAFNAGAAGVKSIEGLIILRFLAGIFGASPMTNAGGVVADTLDANKRGLGKFKSSFGIPCLLRIAPYHQRAVQPDLPVADP
jgi:hypothetical protein